MRKLLKPLFLAALVGGYAATANAQTIILHSLDPDTASGNIIPMPYMDLDGDFALTSAVSSVGGNTNYSLYTSANFDLVGERTATFNADLPTDGEYEVFVTVGVQNAQRAVPHIVTYEGGTESSEIFIDQNDYHNEWHSLGIYQFLAAEGGKVTIGNWGEVSSGNVTIDSVMFEYIPEPSTYAAIFGGFALLGAFIWRRRSKSKN